MIPYCILGHSGMVGRAISRALAIRGDERVIFPGADLCNQTSTRKIAAEIGNQQVETVIMCAGRVGGIKRNMDEPAQMLMENLRMAANVVEMCHSVGAKLVYLGSSCIYPRNCPQPMKEEYLLTGPLEPTNEQYALAKICGIKLCEAYARQYRQKYLALMPCNMFGPYDHFEGDGVHMVPALIKRFSEAADTQTATASSLDIEYCKSVTVWGTGNPRREIMHVDDFASAALHLIDRNATGLINVGTGLDFSIDCIARMIAQATGYTGEIAFDPSRPDGMPRKVLDVSRMRDYGVPEFKDVQSRLIETVAWYLNI